MTQAAQPGGVLGFGVFELDLDTGELRRQGARVPLQEQPTRLLGLLIEHAGELVSREEIEARLWPNDGYGDLDHRLNNAVNKIRVALGDSADGPRFLETLPRRGYRFVAPVHQVGSAIARSSGSSPRRRPRSVGWAAAAMLVVVGASAAIWLAARTSSRDPADKVMLAVLPFRNIGGDPSADYLADGLTEEVILQLGRLSSSNLGVIARTSVTPYRTTEKGIRSIGEELGVDYILEGSVRQESDRLRITAQLVHVDQQTPLWAESYNRTIADVFSVQRDVAERTSASLALAVLPPPGNRPASPTISRAAHRAYLKGTHFRDQGTEKGFHRAIDYFEIAVDEDPAYARAYAALASCQCLLAGHGLEVIPPDVAMPRAKELALKALALDAGLPEAQAVLGMVRMKYEWNFEGAEENFQRAIELNPSYAQAHFWYSLFLEAMGRQEEAVLQARQARELNPISRGASANMAMQLVNAGRFAEASAEIEEALELDDGFWGTHWVLGNLHARQGDQASAGTAFERAVDLSSRNSVSLTSLGFTYGTAGRTADAKAVLHELQELAEERYLSPISMATIHAGLGENDEAFEWLEEALRLRSRYLVWLKVAPEFATLRSDPRFPDLIARIGLP